MHACNMLLFTTEKPEVYWREVYENTWKFKILGGGLTCFSLLQAILDGNVWKFNFGEFWLKE